MYHKIYNCRKDRWESVNSKNGKKLITNYVKYLIAGSAPSKDQATAFGTPTNVASVGKAIPSEASKFLENFIDAVHNNDIDMVKVLLADERVNPNMADEHGRTALMFAAHNGHAPVVTLLLADERVDPNMANQHGRTALMYAAKKGHAPVVTLLLADERVGPNIKLNS